MVPTPLEASVNATSRVRSLSAAWNESLVERGVAGAQVDPAHGGAGVAGRQHPRTHVGVVVEPGDHDLVPAPSVRVNDRAKWKSRDVELGPNTIRSGSVPTRSAPARRAAATVSSSRGW